MGKGMPAVEMEDARDAKRHLEMKINQRSVSLLIIAALAVTYILFIAVRPYEDDESLYILSGKAIIEGNLNPLKVEYYGHYGNPFLQIIGSPLAPMIYGLGYIMGGVLLSRAFAAAFIVSSLFLVYKMTSKLGGSPSAALLIAGVSSCTVLLASDALLDSVSVFFLVLSIYLIGQKRQLPAGLAAGLAIASKFFTLVPLSLALIYLLSKKQIGLRFIFGLIAILAPLGLLYMDILPTLAGYVFSNKIEGTGLGNAQFLVAYFALYIPAASIVSLASIRRPDVKRNLIFILPAIAVIIFHIVTINYLSFYRQIPFAELPASVLAGIALAKLDRRILALGIAVLVAFNAYVAYGVVNNYPSYNAIQDNLGSVEGRVLAVNPHSLALAKGWEVNSTAENAFSYYFFEYTQNQTTHDGKSDMEDYGNALRDGWFDYAIISHYSPPEFSRYGQIEALVRRYYCPTLVSDRPNGIDIYERCHE